MSQNTTIAGILESRVAAQGERPAYVFLSYGETGVAEERLTYAELDARARAIGSSLQAEGAGGERVALLLPPGPEFIASFFGCLYAGAVAVPALPPRRRGADPRLQAICRDARPRVVLTTASLLPVLESAAAEIPELAAALRMASATEDAADWRRPDVRPEALAFLQYTSGSTSSPKGVMVSHGNLLHNEELIRRTFAQSSGSVVLGWLPLHHDMGLIGTVLQPLYTGAVCYLMTPGAFLQRPARWLEAISRYRATTSGGPNFAYELCVRKVGAAEREGLDLSSWQVAFNGAEPVRAGTLRRFAAAFAPCGFRATAFRPCYGLAEATLLVSGWRQEGEARIRALDAEALEQHQVTDAGDTARRHELVSGGAAMQTVLAVDPESGEPCSPGRVGEIWVAGPSVAQGYWERPEETAATFGARLAGGAGPFLRTGDLGFVSGGEVFLTGRLKDLIILRGRNHYPQDLERTAERSHAGLRAGGGAAFAVDLPEEAGEERLVIVHEVERHARAGLDAGKAGEIAAAVRRGVAEEHEVSVAEVVLIGPETLPRTSSGKVRRSACRDLYLQGGLRVLGASRLSAVADITTDEVPMGSPDWLRRAFAAAARIDPGRIDADLPLSASGLDSLAAVELKQAVEEAAGVSLPLADLLEGMTLRELEARVAGREAMPAMPFPPESGEAAGEHPLSWNQRSLWFLHRLAPESSAYNIAGAARLSPVSPAALGRALQALVDRHPMLRATFADTPGGPVQQVGERGTAGFETVDATGWSDAEVQARLHAEAYRPFDLAAGPLLRAVLLGRGDRGRVLPRPRRAPHRGRFLVDGRAGPRARRLHGGRDPASSSGPVHRLRPPSGADAGEPRGRAVVGALAGAPGRYAAARPAHGPAAVSAAGAAGAAGAARRIADASPLAGAGGGGPPARCRPWLYALRRPARRLAGRALPLERPGGVPHRRPHGWPAGPRVGRGGGLLRQPGALARRALGRPGGRRADGADAPHRARRAGVPGLPLRPAHRAPAARSRPQPAAAGRGHADLRESPGAGACRARGLCRGCSGRPARCRGTGPGVGPPGAARGPARPFPDRGRVGRGARRLPAVGR